MLRYISITIIGGGKSKRMGFCKSLIKINKINITEKHSRLILNIGFFFS